MNKRADATALIREGFWQGMGQLAAYSVIGLATGLIMAALMPELFQPCPKKTSSTGSSSGTCGCGGA